jgi:hypothetical protein
VTQLHAQVKQTDCRLKENQHTNPPLTNKAPGIWSRQPLCLNVDLPKQCTSPMLSYNDCSSSPDGFYENDSPINLWLPFVSSDQNTFRTLLQSQSSPVISRTDKSNIFQNPAYSIFSEGIWRDPLSHCDNSYRTSLSFPTKSDISSHRIF